MLAVVDCGMINQQTERDIMLEIANKHQDAGHPGVHRTLYFARRDIARSITRGMVQSVLKRCQICQSVDPAPVKWRHGSLDVSETWRRLAIDITHFKDKSYLTVVDCGPSRFSLWRLLRRMDADCVTERLGEIFYERGSPAELLADNDTAFRSRLFAVFASRWGIDLRFRAAYRPSGNSIVERNHRTVKVIAARKQCSVAEAVHLYNITPRDAGSERSAPASGVYRYPIRDCIRHSQEKVARQVSARSTQGQLKGEPGRLAKYNLGDMVWVRKPGTRCTDQSKPGIVTKIVSDQVLEVDGTPWHVRDLRHRQSLENECATEVSRSRTSEAAEMEAPLYINAPAPWRLIPVVPASPDGAADRTAANIGGEETKSTDSSDDSFGSAEAGFIAEPSRSEVRRGSPDVIAGSVSPPPSPPLRRSTRLRRPPDRLNYR